ncbi:MAG: YdbL family protein [Desulfamplus sp.]|nr:YdbL family protein [Desulfamplus sp.]
MSKKYLSLYCAIICCIIAVTSLSWADDIKLRMTQRLPAIVEMKKQGIVGENAAGYLEYVTAARPNEPIVNAENSDRQKVYAMIAKQQGVTVEKVGELRAAQIVQRAVPGEFLKRADGTWYQK